MKCNQAFRTANPHRILRSIYRQQMVAHSEPAASEDFIRLKSREVFNLAGLGLSHTALYSILTKLAVTGQLSVHSDPEHKQGYKYSITQQGMRCCKCQGYQEGFEPIPVDFICGPVALDF